MDSWINCYVIIGILCISRCYAVTITFSTSSVSLELNQSATVQLLLSSPVNERTPLTFRYFDPKQVEFENTEENPKHVIPLEEIDLIPEKRSYTVQINPIKIGSVIIGLNTTSNEITGLDSQYLTVFVVNSMSVVTLATVIGWAFFIVWSLCVYPLFWTVFQTKRLDGISFDFIVLCEISFIAYTVFCCALYYSDTIKKEYQTEHPGGVQPVQIQDVVLTVQLTILFTIFCFLMCFMESGGQRVSNMSIVITVLSIVYALILLILALTNVMSWISTMYALAVIKMITMPLKYIPQVMINHRRKSTKGFNVLFSWMDGIAGFLTILQMIVIAANGDDWTSFLGNFPKLIVGSSGLIFDLVMLIQHHCFYESGETNNYQNLQDGETTSPCDPESHPSRREDQVED